MLSMSHIVRPDRPQPSLYPPLRPLKATALSGKKNCERLATIRWAVKQNADLDRKRFLTADYAD
jgi:hypothetical protein